MRLSALRIWVADMEAARRFYGATLGLACKWDFGNAVGYDVGDPMPIVEPDDGFLAPPERQPWGGTLAHFRDPSGNGLTLLGE
ncbi:MAG: hypothetical protein IT548_02225 [Alphaproteobacteria bacterium]|nr:hypothetical protein [Alphaproteobacteria bacterium]